MIAPVKLSTAHCIPGGDSASAIGSMSEKILTDINQLLDMARFYIDEEDKEVIQIVELTQRLTATLQRQREIELEEQ